MNRMLSITGAFLLGLASSLSAATLDGSKPMLCALRSSFDCVHQSGCEVLELGPGDDFWRIDVAKKMVGTVNGVRTSPISEVKSGNGQLLMHGAQNDRLWNLVLDQESGRMSAAVVDAEGTVALAGSCIVAP